MPQYRFFDEETREYFVASLEDDEHVEQYLAANPHIIKTFFPPNIHTNTIGSNQHGKAFREVLNKIHNKTPGSQLNKTTEI